MKKLITILALGLASILHAGEDPFAFKNDSLAVANDISFSHFSVFLEGGEIYPMGDLMDAVEYTLYGGIGVRYTYWENVDGIVILYGFISLLAPSPLSALFPAHSIQ